MTADIGKYLDLVIPWVSMYSVKLVTAIIIFVVGRWLAHKISHLLSRLLERNKVDITLVGFLSSIVYYALIIVVLIASAGQLGINTTSFLTILGTAGLAIGLALKDSLSNFAAGVMLIFFKPFRVGDVVTAGGVTGKVNSITIFNTILSTADNQRLIVPNGNITSGVITNATANTTRRVDMIIGISYDDDIRKARQLLEEILAADARILKTPAPVIVVSALADSSVNLGVRPWVNTQDYWDVYFSLMETIKLTFDREGITIPYPQQDVHLHAQSVPAA